jgi:hypothetical protein
MPSAQQQAFTPQGYRALLAALLDRGYETRMFADADSTQAHLIVRHDVDMELRPALSIAEIEAEDGIKATYFILVRSELYNAASQADSSTIRRIAELGHQIGLHFDAALYSGSAESFTVGMKTERDILGQISGVDVTALSFHRPAPALVGEAVQTLGLLNAYDPRFVSDFAYVSDSRGGWHHGHPLDHAAVEAGRGLHLLTHPIWWASPEADPQSKLEAFLERRFDLLDQDLANNCKTYSARRN